jgi:hypothetical protein
VKVRGAAKAPVAHTAYIPGQYQPLPERFSIHNFHMDGACAIELDHSTANQVAFPHYNMADKAASIIRVIASALIGQS